MDVDLVLLQTSAGSSIRGRLTLDAYNNTKPPAMADIELSPVPVDFDQAPSTAAVAKINAGGISSLTASLGCRGCRCSAPPQNGH